MLGEDTVGDRSLGHLALDLKPQGFRLLTQHELPGGRCFSSVGAVISVVDDGRTFVSLCLLSCQGFRWFMVIVKGELVMLNSVPR